MLIGLDWAREFAARFGRYLDGFIELPGFPGLPECPPQVERFPKFLEEVQARPFDLVIQLHGSGEVTNVLTALCGGRECAGFFRPGRFCPDPERFLAYPDHGLEVRRLLRLMEFLGIPSRGEELEFPLSERDHGRLGALVGENEPIQSGEYVCVHPGASVPERRWATEHFAQVARVLAGEGLRIVLTGTEGERALTRAIAQDLPSPALDLAGQTDLGTLAALVSGARLLVCNDTGISHVAAGLKVPSVVLSTGENPERWSPPDTKRHRVVRFDEGLRPDEVIALAQGLLKEAAQPVG